MLRQDDESDSLTQKFKKNADKIKNKPWRWQNRIRIRKWVRAKKVWKWARGEWDVEMSEMLKWARWRCENKGDDKVKGLKEQDSGWIFAMLSDSRVSTCLKYPEGGLCTKTEKPSPDNLLIDLS